MKKNVFFLFLLFITSNISAAIWYVKLDASSTAWDSKPAANVKTSILDAFNAAAANDEIWVSFGVEKIAAVLEYNKHIKVYGSFFGTENSITEREKIADGKPWEFANQTYVEQNTGITTGFMKVPSGQNVIINGLHFRNFNTTGVAVCHIRQNTRIENCVFDTNTSNTDGAGVSIYPGGHIKDSYFYNNKAKTSTGVFANVLNQPASIIGCTFEKNEGEYGAALNLKNSGGHGLGFSYIVKNNIVINNKATAAGTNSIVALRWEECEISNMLIANNEGIPLHIENGTFTNGTIVNNRVKNAAVLIDALVTATNPSKLNNTVVWNNKTGDEATLGIKVNSNSFNISLKNNAADIATNNTPAVITEGDFVLLEESNTGTEVGKNYPEFSAPSPFLGISADNESAIRDVNWAIGSGSSALIDAGDDLLVHGSVEDDLAGTNRFDGTVDIGAYEFDKAATSNKITSDNLGSVRYVNGTLLLQGVDFNLPLTVYTVSGGIVSQTLTAPAVSLPLSRGIYIVRVNAENYKIIVK